MKTSTYPEDKIGVMHMATHQTWWIPVEASRQGREWILRLQDKWETPLTGSYAVLCAHLVGANFAPFEFEEGFLVLDFRCEPGEGRSEFITLERSMALGNIDAFEEYYAMCELLGVNPLEIQLAPEKPRKLNWVQRLGRWFSRKRKGQGEKESELE